MFKKPTKNQLLIRRIIFSSIATFAVIIIATITILLMLGYRLDSDNGRLEQGALLQFDSSPNGANVYIDGKDIGSRTATKQTVIAGEHTVKMVRFGYEDWSRTVNLDAGTLTWLDYIRFVPTDKPVEDVRTYDTLAGLIFSGDNRWAIALPAANTPTFELIDLRSEEVRTSTMTIAESYYAGQTVETAEPVEHSFNLVSWDEGGRYVLIKHLYAGQTEWLVLDTQDVGRTVNITRLLGVGFKSIEFASTNGEIFYGLTDDGAIRKIDLSAGTLSRTFVTHVESFSIYDNKVITYVGVDPSDATKRVVGVYRDGDDAGHILHSTTDPEISLKIATGRYFSNDYVAIAEGNVVRILKGAYPTSSADSTDSLKQFANFSLEGAINALSFSPDGDYVTAQSGASYGTYDIEHKQHSVRTIAVNEGTSATTLKWLDDAYLWSDDDNMLTMRDFDGSNVYGIMSVASGYDASLSQNGRFFYAVGTENDTYQLQRVKMVLD